LKLTRIYFGGKKLKKKTRIPTNCFKPISSKNSIFNSIEDYPDETLST
jgi:hypothetical protein